jgi:hypothetical protein
MLTMRVELWPFGDESRAKRLVTINIANLGQDILGGYSYAWTIDEPTPLIGKPIKAQGILMGYDRNASCVDMISSVLKDYELPYVVDFTDEDTDTFQRLRNKTNHPLNR